MHTGRTFCCCCGCCFLPSASFLTTVFPSPPPFAANPPSFPATPPRFASSTTTVGAAGTLPDLKSDFACSNYMWWVCCRVLRGVAVCCGVLRCVAVRCSVLQRVAVKVE